MSSWFRSILCCYSPTDAKDDRPALQISRPTNFRREEISIPGLTTSEYTSPDFLRPSAIPLTELPNREALIRTTSRTDNARMLSTLRPLASAPSIEFAVRPERLQMAPTREEVDDAAMPKRPQNPSPSSANAANDPPNTPSTSPSPIEWVRAHGRALSNEIRKSWDYVHGQAYSHRREGSNGNRLHRGMGSAKGPGIREGPDTDTVTKGLTCQEHDREKEYAEGSTHDDGREDDHEIGRGY